MISTSLLLLNLLLLSSLMRMVNTAIMHEEWWSGPIKEFNIHLKGFFITIWIKISGAFLFYMTVLAVTLRLPWQNPLNTIWDRQKQNQSHFTCVVWYRNIYIGSAPRLSIKKLIGECFCQLVDLYMPNNNTLYTCYSNESYFPIYESDCCFQRQVAL